MGDKNIIYSIKSKINELKNSKDLNKYKRLKTEYEESVKHNKWIGRQKGIITRKIRKETNKVKLKQLISAQKGLDAQKIDIKELKNKIKAAKGENYKIQFKFEGFGSKIYSTGTLLKMNNPEKKIIQDYKKMVKDEINKVKRMKRKGEKVEKVRKIKGKYQTIKVEPSAKGLYKLQSKLDEILKYLKEEEKEKPHKKEVKEPPVQPPEQMEVEKGGEAAEKGKRKGETPGFVSFEQIEDDLIAIG